MLDRSGASAISGKIVMMSISTSAAKLRVCDDSTANRETVAGVCDSGMCTILPEIVQSGLTEASYSAELPALFPKSRQHEVTIAIALGAFLGEYDPSFFKLADAPLTFDPANASNERDKITDLCPLTIGQS